MPGVNQSIKVQFVTIWSVDGVFCQLLPPLSVVCIGCCCDRISQRTLSQLIFSFFLFISLYLVLSFKCTLLFKELVRHIILSTTLISNKAVGQANSHENIYTRGYDFFADLSHIFVEYIHPLVYSTPLHWDINYFDKVLPIQNIYGEKTQLGDASRVKGLTTITR